MELIQKYLMIEKGERVRLIREARRDNNADADVAKSNLEGSYAHPFRISSRKR